LGYSSIRGTTDAAAIPSASLSAVSVDRIALKPSSTDNNKIIDLVRISQTGIRGRQSPSWVTKACASFESAAHSIAAIKAARRHPRRKNPAPRWPVWIAHALGPQRGQKKKARQINPGRGKNGGSRVHCMAQLCFRRVSSWRSFGFVLPPGPFICAQWSCTSTRGSGMGCTRWHRCWPWRRHARLPGDEGGERQAWPGRTEVA
jgi:hypothetical protein